MSGLATIVKNLGFKVTGSDLHRSDITKRLKRIGIQIRYGHKRYNVVGADVVVYSSAIKQENAEMAEARQRNIPIIPKIKFGPHEARNAFK